MASTRKTSPSTGHPSNGHWLIQEEDEKVGWKTKGALATYVDDVLMVGEEDIILGSIEQVKTHWKHWMNQNGWWKGESP